ncbi:DUF2786 domain-containing protein [Xenorhabdus thuongxuanensis]|uniref:Uncharacterized protein n=1 Tax=Xenorhabdus thuongxuanensis TaxID=1873484 RepID=A0A1Q5U474_9GAMM|nr:DUF2786 domain-containing protein [Xenorhabdus thuongxuanensis]OKP07278.1 hypothetical protein Xentx_01555 [Xenorhabdus thuongxuanensis]
MNHNNERIISKLKKLYALSKSSNPHEAAVALRRAQKLMQAYSISEDEIALSDIDESISDYWPVGQRRPPVYMLGLIAIIRDAFGVCSLLLNRVDTQVSFYGPKERTALAAYTYEVLGRQLMKARKEYINNQNKCLKKTTKTSRGDKFAEGWVLAVLNEIVRLSMSQEEEELVYQWLKEKYANTTEVSGREAKKARGSMDAMNAGYRKGELVRLHQPVSGQEQMKIGSTV